jgi:ribonuclease III
LNLFSFFFTKKKLSSYELKVSNYINKTFGYYPKEIDKYVIAFTHKSFSRNLKHHETNERLELLGDAILDSVIADFLFHRYKNQTEGFISKLKSKIVSRNTLNDIGEKLELYPIIRKNISEKQKVTSINGNAFEALIGAIYLDQGFDKTLELIKYKIINKFINVEDLIKQETDFKSKLLIWAQQNKKQTEFILKNKINPSNPTFEIAFLLDEEEIAVAKDRSKKRAEQKVSEIVCSKINIS